MIALLTGAVMFALGLFFGWLLHRERVERALYEDAVRARDRATTTLAEASARLELANKDMIRLREQLTDAQRGLDGGGGDTEADVASGEHAEPTDDAVDDDEPADIDTALDPPSATVQTGTAPADAQLFDQLEFDENEVVPDEITDEIPVAAMPDAAGDGDADRDSDEDVVPDVDPDSDDDASGDVIGDVPAVAGEAIDPPPETGIGEPLVVGPVDEDAPITTPEDTESGDMVGEVPEVDESATAPEVSEEPAVPESDDVAAVAAVTADDVPVGMPIADDDDLRQIAGVGPALERMLHEQGIRTFRDLAVLDQPAIDGLRERSPRLANRLQRGAWVSRARRLHVDTYGDEP